MRIRLSRGKFAQVSRADVSRLSKFSWHAVQHRNGNFYAMTAVYINGRQKRIPMARFVSRAPKGKLADHKNGDTLDNRRSNLRVCSRSENGRGFRRKKAGASKYRGVSWSKQDGKWFAQIRLHLGLFSSEKAAAKAYDRAAKKLYGRFACPNFSR